MAISKRETIRKGQIRNCPECKSTSFVEYREGGYSTVCMDCGFVVSAKPAERCFAKTNADLHKQNRLTRICREQPKSLVKGKKESISENLAVVLEKWKSIKIADSTEKNLALGLQSLAEIAINLFLSKTALEKACTIYKRIIERELTKGRSMITLASATMYMACKECGIARTIDDIASLSNISAKEISRSFKLLARELAVSVLPAKPIEHIVRISAKLTLREETIKIANTILKEIEKMKLLSGKNPAGIAAAAVYISSLIAGELKTQREIAEVTRVTETTIRNRCRDLKNLLLFSDTL
jgi:transcription initiation factor TFIIB